MKRRLVLLYWALAVSISLAACSSQGPEGIRTPTRIIISSQRPTSRPLDYDYCAEAGCPTSTPFLISTAVPETQTPTPRPTYEAPRAAATPIICDQDLNEEEKTELDEGVKQAIRDSLSQVPAAREVEIGAAKLGIEDGQNPEEQARSWAEPGIGQSASTTASYLYWANICNSKKAQILSEADKNEAARLRESIKNNGDPLDFDGWARRLENSAAGLEKILNR